MIINIRQKYRQKQTKPNKTSPKKKQKQMQHSTPTPYKEDLKTVVLKQPFDPRFHL